VELITPPLYEGCTSGIMRKNILKIAGELKLETEEKPLSEKDIIKSKEIILSNAIHGIKWIGAYKDRRYYNFIAKKLINVSSK
jgi:branched-chain amino acid aminotransferase